ncbi:MAG: hypothetical protein ACE5FE_04540 [Acidiferrobacterales bacterium]
MTPVGRLALIKLSEHESRVVFIFHTLLLDGWSKGILLKEIIDVFESLPSDNSMQIELMGCTGAGKSTLIRGMLEDCRAGGLVAWRGDDFALQQAGLTGLKDHLGRTLLVDLFSLFGCLLAWPHHRPLLEKTVHRRSSSWIDYIDFTAYAVGDMKEATPGVAGDLSLVQDSSTDGPIIVTQPRATSEL